MIRRRVRTRATIGIVGAVLLVVVALVAYFVGAFQAHHNTVSASALQLTTSLSGGGQSGASIRVPRNTTVTDSAQLAGPGVGSAKGTITYGVYSNKKCTTLVRSSQTEPVSVPGVLPASGPVALSAPGIYYWQASYSGAGENQHSVGGCGSEVEVVSRTITLKPQVYQWGAYFFYGPSADQFSPRGIVDLSDNVVAINASNNSSYALECAGGTTLCHQDGSVWAFGRGALGELGDGSKSDSLTSARRVAFPSDVHIVSIGEAEDSGYAIDSTGQGWEWGAAVCALSPVRPTCRRRSPASRVPPKCKALEATSCG